MTSKEAIKLLKWHGNDREDVMELYKVIEDELEDAKHNYKALKEFYDNSVAYGAKIQNELNELKRDFARYLELEGNYQKSSHEYHEMEYIKNKLSKVGKGK